jgi:hypothetical protein
MVEQLDVLLRHRLLPQPGGFEGLLSRQVSVHPRDFSLAKAIEPGEGLLYIDATPATPASRIGDQENAVVADLRDLPNIDVNVHNRIQKPIPEQLTHRLAPPERPGEDRRRILEDDVIGRCPIARP